MDTDDIQQPPEVDEEPDAVLLDADAWAATRDRLELLEAQALQQAHAERDQVIADAVREGRLFPAQTDHFRQLWTLDPHGTRSAIQSLPKNSALAVKAMGYDGDGDGDARDARDPYAHLFPPISRRSR